MFNKVEAILLSNCPYLTDILLKELSSTKEMLGLNIFRANKKMIAMKLYHRDILALLLWIFLLRWTIFSISIRKVTIPTKLPSGKKKDIA